VRGTDEGLSAARTGGDGTRGRNSTPIPSQPTRRVFPSQMYGVPEDTVATTQRQRADPSRMENLRIHISNRDISVSGKTSRFAPSCRTFKPPANLQLSRVQSIRFSDRTVLGLAHPGGPSSLP